MTTLARDKFETYLEGWRLGNGALSKTALAPDFYYHDPNSGRYTNDEFVGFMDAFKRDSAALMNGQLGSPFLTYSDIVIDETASPSTAWCWWQVTGADLQGAALIHFDGDGVRSERIAYFSTLPENSEL